MGVCVCVCVVNHCVNSVFTHVFSVRNKPSRKAVVPQKKLGHFKANLFFSDFLHFIYHICTGILSLTQNTVKKICCSVLGDIKNW